MKLHFVLQQIDRAIFAIDAPHSKEAVKQYLYAAKAELKRFFPTSQRGVVCQRGRQRRHRYITGIDPVDIIAHPVVCKGPVPADLIISAVGFIESETDSVSVRGSLCDPHAFYVP